LIPMVMMTVKILKSNVAIRMPMMAPRGAVLEAYEREIESKQARHKAGVLRGSKV
jgi:hypothetical protein